MQTKKLTIGGRGVDMFDGGVVLAGAVCFLLGFVRFFGRDGVNFDGWSSGFFGSFGLSLCFLAALMVVGRLFLGLTLTVGTRFGPAVLTFLVATAGAVLLVLKFVTGFSVDGGGVSLHLDRQIGLYLAIIIAVLEAVAAFLAITTAGEKLPR